MNKIVIGNLIFNCFYSTLLIIFVCENEGYFISWWASLVIAIVPSVLTCLVTLFISRKSQINQNTEEIKKMTRQLELNDEQSLRHQLERQYHMIKNEIGKTENDKTLTGQHKDMQNMLQKEIETAERRYQQEETRIRNFTMEQHNMAKTMEEFQLFLESWKRMADESHNLMVRASKLEQENEQLKKQIHQTRHRNEPEL